MNIAEKNFINLWNTIVSLTVHLEELGCEVVIKLPDGDDFDSTDIEDIDAWADETFYPAPPLH